MEERAERELHPKNIMERPKGALHPKKVSKLSLQCKEVLDKNNNSLYLCNTKNANIEHLNYEDIINDPIATIRNPNEEPNKSSNNVGIVILASLIGGFGFAVASFTWYVLYDYFAYDSFTFNWARFLVAFGLLLAILIGLVIIT